MAFLPRPARPSRAIADLWQFVKARRPHEAGFLLLSVALTGLWFVAIFDKLYPEPEWQPPPVMYVTQWSGNRTAADVKAQQAKDLPAELEAKRLREEAALKKRQQYQRLADQLGID